MGRISYRTATLECALGVHREGAWAALGDVTTGRATGLMLDQPVGAATEVVLSDEPPWRRVVRLDGDHTSALIQTSFTIRDDGPRCLVAWSCLIDPTGVAEDELDRTVAVVTADGSAQLDRLAELTAAAST